MTRVLWIPRPMPNMNEIITACGTLYKVGRGGKRRSKYTDMKESMGHLVALFARQQGFAAITRPAHFEYEFVEQNRMRDPSNIIAGGVKIIEDALQDCGLLEGDGWAQVLSISPTWRVDKNLPGVRITVREE